VFSRRHALEPDQSPGPVDELCLSLRQGDVAPHANLMSNSRQNPPPQFGIEDGMLNSRTATAEEAVAYPNGDSASVRGWYLN
jgi:hypothetical protein